MFQLLQYFMLILYYILYAQSLVLQKTISINRRDATYIMETYTQIEKEMNNWYRVQLLSR